VTVDDIRTTIHDVTLNECVTDDMMVVVDEVVDFFGGNETQAVCWFQVSNVNLGGKSPLEMIQAGRFHKLVRFIRTSMDTEQA